MSERELKESHNPRKRYQKACSLVSWTETKRKFTTCTR